MHVTPFADPLNGGAICYRVSTRSQANERYATLRFTPLSSLRSHPAAHFFQIPSLTDSQLRDEQETNHEQPLARYVPMEVVEGQRTTEVMALETFEDVNTPLAGQLVPVFTEYIGESPRNVDDEDMLLPTEDEDDEEYSPESSEYEDAEDDVPEEGDLDDSSESSGDNEGGGEPVWQGRVFH